MLAHEYSRHVGEGVAVVVAETLAQAKDAAELIEIDYEPLPSCTSTAEAPKPGAATVWPDQPDNICFVHELGNKTAVEAAFAKAAHVAKLDLVITRITTNSMEPRCAIGEWDPREERYTLYGSVQGPHNARAELAGRIFNVAENRIRVVAPDVGGGFGMKGSPHPELALVLWAAKKVGRPVKWVAERSEGIISDHHARDNVCHAELALDKDGNFLALRTHNIANLGAYLAFNGIHCAVNNLGGMSGVYTTPAIYAHVTGVFTNTSPTAPYRGAGRPEASYIVERLIDQAARDLKMDPAELRRRNLIPPIETPYNTGFIFTYDSGEFEHNQNAVLKLADWSGFEARREEAKRRGKLRGIGMSHVIEIAAGPAPVPFEEFAGIRFDASGAVTLVLGTHNHGQGHETTFRQVMVELLGLDPKNIRIIYGDTDAVPWGKGTYGSRSMAVGGGAVYKAAEKISPRARSSPRT